MLTKSAPDPDQILTRNVPSEIRDQRSESKQTKEGKGLCSPPPSVFVVVREVWHHLEAGLAWLDPNDYGRPWPPPRRSLIVSTCQKFPADLCVKAAREAREIVIAQDRAPNITGLFEKKLRDLAEVRSAVRESLEVA